MFKWLKWFFGGINPGKRVEEYDEANEPFDDGYREFPADLYGILEDRFSRDSRVAEFSPSRDQRSQVGYGHWVNAGFRIPQVETPPEDCVPYIYTCHREGEIVFTVCAPDAMVFPENLRERLVERFKAEFESFRARYGGEFRDPVMSKDPYKMEMTKVAVRLRLSPKDREAFVHVLNDSLRVLPAVVEVWGKTYRIYSELDERASRVLAPIQAEYWQLMKRIEVWDTG